MAKVGVELALCFPSAVLPLRVSPGSPIRIGSPAKETFLTEVEVLREELMESEVVIEGEFASEAQLMEWGFSELLA